MDDWELAANLDTSLQWCASWCEVVTSGELLGSFRPESLTIRWRKTQLYRLFKWRQPRRAGVRDAVDRWAAQGARPSRRFPNPATAPEKAESRKYPTDNKKQVFGISEK